MFVTEWQRHWQRMMKQKTALSPRGPPLPLVPRDALVQLHAAETNQPITSPRSLGGPGSESSCFLSGSQTLTNMLNY